MSEAECKFLIYGLADPRTGHVRYIGKSAQGLRRPNQHRKPERLRSITHKNCWVKGLLAEGLDYVIVALEECDAKTLDRQEREWIAYARANAWPLTNMTDGGDGTLGREVTPSTRAKISAGRTGQMKTAETRLKMATAQRKKAEVLGLPGEAELRQAYEIERKTLPELAARYSRSPGTVWGWLKKFGIETRSTKEAARLNPRAVTEAEIQQMRDLYAAGFSSNDIARKVGRDGRLVRTHLKGVLRPRAVAVRLAKDRLGVENVR